MTEEQNQKWKDNLIMYLETCMVDHGGRFRWNKIGDDKVFLDELKKERLINYERIPFKEVEKNRYNLGPAGPFTHLITNFTDELWDKATQLRRERASRLSASLRRKPE